MKPYKNRSVVEGQKVFVYFEYRKKLFSVQSMEGPTKGLVIAHADKLSLVGGCEFRVSQKRRQQVIEEQRKNVHAGIVGRLDLSGKEKERNTEITYDPYKFSSFVERETGKKVEKASSVFCEKGKVFI